jgi:hypothetical protein
MSKETKQAPLNLYGILDNELARMHALLQTYMTLPKDDGYGSGYGGLSHGKSFGSPGTIPQIYQRLMNMQDLLMKAVIAHDGLVQEKVAEVALMGVNNEPND